MELHMGLPPGFKFLNLTKTSQRSLQFYQTTVVIITFSAYACFHASRKPPSIVKSVLGPGISSPELINTSISIENAGSNNTSGGWAPFDGIRGTHRLGELDLAFLSMYSLGMYWAGHIGDRIDLRLFLTLGMLGSGLFTIMFGLGYWLKIHSFAYFLAIQMISGLFQSTGWPSVVAVMGNWFGKSKRGLIMGIWNAHTSFGNIFGSLIASAVLHYGWGWSFVLPGISISLVGFLVFFFLVVCPEDVGFSSSSQSSEIGLYRIDSKLSNGNVSEDSEMKKEMAMDDGSVRIIVGTEGEEEGLLDPSKLPEVPIAIGFIDAWRLPGVAPYAFCLFFSKLVAYTFLYWLPFYIRHTAVAGSHLSDRAAGILSTIFDMGGVFGGILAGYISDRIGARAMTSVAFFFFSIPSLILYRIYGGYSMHTNIGLMFISGLLVNGPYSLITTAVAADLGTQSSIKGNSRALATVTAIIDGTGSVGAALGPLLTGYISSRGWNGVFAMLILAILLASLFLMRIAREEVLSKMRGSIPVEQN